MEHLNLNRCEFIFENFMEHFNLNRCEFIFGDFMEHLNLNRCEFIFGNFMEHLNLNASSFLGTSWNIWIWIDVSSFLGTSWTIWINLWVSVLGTPWKKNPVNKKAWMGTHQLTFCILWVHFWEVYKSNLPLAIMGFWLSSWYYFLYRSGWLSSHLVVGE